MPLDELQNEVDKAPSGGDYWKPDEGVYKGIAGPLSFEDAKFEREGKTVEERQCHVPLTLMQGGQVTGETIFSFKVSKGKNSKCQAFMNAGLAALEQGAEEGKIPLVFDIKGSGLDRTWGIYSLKDYEAKMEKAKNVLG